MITLTEFLYIIIKTNWQFQYCYYGNYSCTFSLFCCL